MSRGLLILRASPPADFDINKLLGDFCWTAPGARFKELFRLFARYFMLEAQVFFQSRVFASKKTTNEPDRDTISNQALSRDRPQRRRWAFYIIYRLNFIGVLTRRFGYFSQQFIPTIGRYRGFVLAFAALNDAASCAWTAALWRGRNIVIGNFIESKFSKSLGISTFVVLWALLLGILFGIGGCF